jgi:hypothetical protein
LNDTTLGLFLIFWSSLAFFVMAAACQAEWIVPNMVSSVKFKTVWLDLYQAVGTFQARPLGLLIAHEVPVML